MAHIQPTQQQKAQTIRHQIRRLDFLVESVLNCTSAQNEVYGVQIPADIGPTAKSVLKAKYFAAGWHVEEKLRGRDTYLLFKDAMHKDARAQQRPAYAIVQCAYAL